jgi:hypothetical protein
MAWQAESGSGSAGVSEDMAFLRSHAQPQTCTICEPEVDIAGRTRDSPQLTREV